MALTLDTFVGNAHVVSELKIELEACKRRNVRLDHVLITGYSGTGKTRLANTMAQELGVNFLDINAPMVEDLYSDVLRDIWITDESKNDFMVCVPTIVFFDEAHDLSKGIQTILLKIMLEQKVTYNTSTYDLRNVTFIFATTDGDKLLGPLKQRCELRFELQRYSEAEMTHILKRVEVEDAGNLYELTASDAVANFVAKRSRFTPRIGLGYMRRLYNHARAKSESPFEAAKLLTPELAEEFFDLRRINPEGLTPKDIDYLRTLDHARKPMGVASIAAQLEVNDAECKRDIEPFLRYCRLINFDKGGRSITPKGIEVLRRFEEREAMQQRMSDMALGV